MAKIEKIEIEVNVLCALSKEELRWLQSITQSPLNGQTLKEESELDSKMRHNIFDLAKKAFEQISHKSKETLYLSVG